VLSQETGQNANSLILLLNSTDVWRVATSAVFYLSLAEVYFITPVDQDPILNLWQFDSYTLIRFQNSTYGVAFDPGSVLDLAQYGGT